MAPAVKGTLRPSYMERVNLARVLRDGGQIHVPRFGEVLPTPTPYGVSADGQIDSNPADASLLRTLCGIGAAIVWRIVEYCEMSESFEMIKGIQEINDVGPATSEQNEGRMTVGETQWPAATQNPGPGGKSGDGCVCTGRA